MGLFDKVKETLGTAADKAKEAAEIAADKAKDLAETAKQKAKIAEAEKNIKDVYTSMGKALFEQFPDLAKEKFPEQIGKIDEFKGVIEAAKAAIAALADNVGSKVEEVKEEVKEEAEEVKEAVEEKVEEIKEAVK
ncbi:MAG: hypothetical protein IKX89_03060 [Firmicutes bacterium]|nr:hypothetical protein [Bacillota bacterium]